MSLALRRRFTPGTSVSTHIPPPVGGLNTIDPGYAIPDTDCPLLYNMIGAENGLRARLGWKEWCTGVGSSAVPTIIPFSGSSTDGSKDRLFATSTGTAKIYSVGASSAAPTAVLTFGSSAGDAGWGVSHAVINSAGNHFLMYFDEQNGYHVYTESSDTWAAVAAGSGAAQVSGVDPAKFVFGTVWKNYVLFVEKDTSRMWFGVDPNSLYGLVTSFDFGSKFKHGGNLVGLWSWTNDGGTGVDDYLVAVGSGGDVLVYKGTNPNTAFTFSLVGVWFVGGVPKGRRIATDHGGDLLILSNLGVIAMSRLVNGISIADRSQYSTFKIGNVFNPAVSTYGSTKGWSLRIHPEDATLLITLPPANGAYPQLAMSVFTRGWAQYRDLPMVSNEAWGGKLYFGTNDGRVCQHTEYLDAVDRAVTTFTPIDCSMVSAFRNNGNGRQKQIGTIRPTVISAAGSVAISVQARYRYDLSEATRPTSTASNASNVWDTAVWGTALWGGAFQTQQPVFGATGMGPDMAVAFRMETTSRTVLVGLDVTFTEGGQF